MLHLRFTAESDGERIVKIGQHLAKLWVRIGYTVYFTHGILPPSSPSLLLPLLHWLLTTTTTTTTMRNVEPLHVVSASSQPS